MTRAQRGQPCCPAQVMENEKEKNHADSEDKAGSYSAIQEMAIRSLFDGEDLEFPPVGHVYHNTDIAGLTISWEGLSMYHGLAANFERSKDGTKLTFRCRHRKVSGFPCKFKLQATVQQLGEQQNMVVIKSTPHSCDPRAHDIYCLCSGVTLQRWLENERPFLENLGVRSSGLAVEPVSRLLRDKYGWTFAYKTRRSMLKRVIAALLKTPTGHGEESNRNDAAGGREGSGDANERRTPSPTTVLEGTGTSIMDVITGVVSSEPSLVTEAQSALEAPKMTTTRQSKRLKKGHATQHEEPKRRRRNKRIANISKRSGSTDRKQASSTRLNQSRAAREVGRVSSISAKRTFDQIDSSGTVKAKRFASALVHRDKVEQQGSRPKDMGGGGDDALPLAKKSSTERRARDAMTLLDLESSSLSHLALVDYYEFLAAEGICEPIHFGVTLASTEQAIETKLAELNKWPTSATSDEVEADLRDYKKSQREIAGACEMEILARSREKEEDEECRRRWAYSSVSKQLKQHAVEERRLLERPLKVMKTERRSSGNGTQCPFGASCRLCHGQEHKPVAEIRSLLPAYRPVNVLSTNYNESGKPGARERSRSAYIQARLEATVTLLHEMKHSISFLKGRKDW